MKIGTTATVSQGPVTDAIDSAVEHRGQRQFGTQVVGPPGIESKSGIEPQLMVPALQADVWWGGEDLIALPLAIGVEAVDRPISVWSEIDLPVVRLVRKSQKCFKAGTGPELITTLSRWLTAIDQALRQGQIRQS